MTPKQEKYIRSMVKELLREDAPFFQDEDFLYRVLKTSGPKISQAIQNLKKKYENDIFFKNRLNRIESGWNELAFGYGELYHRMKKGNRK